MEAGLIGLAGWGLSKIADSLWDSAWEKGSDRLTQSLNKTDIEKAIKSGEKAVKEWEKKLPPQQLLFYPAKRDGWTGVKKFLSQYFEHSAVLTEFQKPLTNQGQPDIDILITIFKQEAEAKNIQLNQKSLKPWIETFVNAYFQQTDTYIKFQVAKQNYFEQLTNWFDDVKFAGIYVPGQEVEKSEKLAYIFVMPDVVEDVSTGGGFERDLLLGGSGELERELLTNTTGRKFLASELLTQSQSRKVVILGAPGSGKTTLMSYFAVMLASIPPTPFGKKSIPPTPLGKGGDGDTADATLRDRQTQFSSTPTKESKSSSPSYSPLSKGGQGGYLGLDPNTDWLPILIKMRDLARHPDKSILEYIRIFAEKTMAVKTLPVGFFEHWLEDGRALILLDGLDEVAESGKRYDVVRRIENFLGQFDRNRAIITSRPAGYRRDFFRTAEFPHYQMQPFDDEKISTFINNWYDSRFKDKVEAERRKESLQKALDDNDRIKLLARNPLLLTIIALIHRYQAVLPKERHRLYNKAVETLLISWDANKELSSDGRLKYLGLDDLRRLMELLAYWVHTQGNVGNGEGGTLIDKDELISQLSREIKGLKQVQLYQAKEEAERFVDLIRERTGLLNEQGQDCYAFVHKTFQEYLCAEEIDYQLENEFDFGIILNAIREHLHDSHWREVLLLLIAQQKPKNAAKAIRAVLNNSSEYEEWLHRDLLFAGNCLAENPKGLRSVGSELVQEILERLVELEVSIEEKVGEKVREEVYRVFCSLYETDFEGEVLEMLKEQADLIDELRLFKYQAELGGEDEVITILLARLQDENFHVRRRATADAFKVGKSSEALLSGLLARLQDEDYYVRWRSTLVLGKLGNSSETVVTTLLARLQDEDSSVRGWAASTLAKLGNGSKTVVSALLAQLRDENYSVRGWTASALAELGKLQNNLETVVSALLALLQDGDSDVSWIAAIALGYLGQSPETLVTTLLGLLQNENSDVQGWAISALGQLGNSSETVISALVALLQDENYSVTLQIATALGRLGNSSETVISALVTLLQDEDSNVRMNAAIALGRLGNSSETVVNTLVARLQDEDSFVRGSAAKALGKLGKKSNNILPTIIQWIQQHQDSEYVGRGIDALWYLVVGEES
ncbi:MAG: HEAT repeat domain-containing protein [Microcoleaceae cyanobacterium MO_207.B10]|nr:HEAT repeat domain-containing protein [Microcoleaceae cyanobacterium MO_207.B10]